MTKKLYAVATYKPNVNQTWRDQLIVVNTKTRKVALRLPLSLETYAEEQADLLNKLNDLDQAIKLLEGNEATEYAHLVLTKKFEAMSESLDEGLL